jgi:hypothetical protein
VINKRRGAVSQKKIYTFDNNGSRNFLDLSYNSLTGTILETYMMSLRVRSVPHNWTHDLFQLIKIV